MRVLPSSLYATGFDKLVALKDLSFDAPTSKWGYADDAVLDYAADAILKRMARGGRSLDVILTLSSHEPFKVPYRRLRNDMLNSFAFTDDCIGRFVERMREFDGALALAEVPLRERVADIASRQHSELDSRSQLLRVSIAHLLERQREGLARAEALVAVASPERLLSRGYAIVSGPQGVVRSAASVAEGSEVEILFADGLVRATIEKVILNVDTE